MRAIRDLHDLKGREVDLAELVRFDRVMHDVTGDQFSMYRHIMQTACRLTFGETYRHRGLSV